MGTKIASLEPCPTLYFFTCYVDSMPIPCIGGVLCDVLFNPNYAGCVYIYIYIYMYVYMAYVY